jgi:DNA topoisomerase-2
MAKSKYHKFTQREHVRKRPDTYIGSIENTTEKRWMIYKKDDLQNENEVEDEEKVSVMTGNSQKSKRSEVTVEKVDVTYNPGLEQCVLELIVNAVDHAQRCQNSKNPVTKIDIKCTEDTFTITNNGDGIPIEIHEEENVYNPELIFGNMLTTENHDDDKERTVGGTNGIGAKAANIFASEFTLDLVCDQKRYIQTFSEGMSKKTEPKIRSKKTKDYTTIIFKPDFEAFGMSSFNSNDTRKLIEKRVYDASATTPKKVNVYFNGEKIPVKEFKDYVELYIGSAKKIIHIQDKWEVAFAMNPFDTAIQISAVNGIFTEDGGRHVDHVINQVVPKVIKEIQNTNAAKKEGIIIKPQYVKDNIIVFVKCLVNNVKFSSQTKTKLTLHPDNFGSKCTIPDDVIKKISKLGIAESIIQLAKAKDLKIFKQATKGTKKLRLKGIPKLDDANKAGGRNSSKCTLILTEGDSAAGSAKGGLSVVGKDLWGVFPLKGKLLNVRTATNKQLNSNEEIININKILGLSHDMKDKSKLRYGRVMCMCDSDVDGFHIKGLLMNYFTHYWPEIVEQGFICSLLTPIVKVTIGKKVRDFYDLHEFNDWKKKNKDQKFKHKYYKGLGTSTDKEMKEYFNNLSKNKIDYTYKISKDSEKSKDEDRLILAFDKTKADDRKEWILKQLALMKEKGSLIDYTQKSVPINNFIDNELVQFSIYDNTRSLPNVLDGLKVSQRKIVYGTFIEKLFKKEKEMKVGNLGASISKSTDYHHGEKSLHDAITNMGQEFVGSGNANILEPSGNFGSRLMGGKDAGAPRYIMTYFKNWVPLVFNEQDFPLLKMQKDDDGNIIEPVNYSPILPLLLINGSTGIGTGWSTDIPCFNPKDIIENLKNLLITKDKNSIKKMEPWYKGFKGTIVKVLDANNECPPNKWISRGMYTYSDKTLKVTELPVGLWIDTFKDKVLSKDFVKSYVGNKTETKNDVDYTINLEKDMTNEEILKEFKLETSINATNMVAFDSNGSIKHYENAEEILWEFFENRSKLYSKRKKHLVKELEKDLNFVSEKARFIKLVVEDTIVVFKRKKDSVVKDLLKHEFEQMDGDFRYLLDIPIRNFTKEKIAELLEKVQKISDELNVLTKKTGSDLWKEDLANLEKTDFFK